MPHMAGLRVFDSLVNFMTGAGTGVDQRTAAFWHTKVTDPAQVQAAYRNSWLHRKIVDLPAQDMTRERRDWQADKDVIAKIEQAERDFGLWAKVELALQLGRLGGGAIILGVAQGQPKDELKPETIGKGQLRYIHTVSRHKLTLGPEVLDLESPLFGGPEYFRLTSGSGAMADIHPSRVIVFKGAPVPPDNIATFEDRFWGDPIYRAVDDAVKNATSAQNGFASLIDKARVRRVGIPNLNQNLQQDPKYGDFLQQRWTLAGVGESTHRTFVHDAAEEVEDTQVSWSGMPEYSAHTLAVVAGASDIPATRLLGKSPDGMNATGDSDMQNYHSMIASKQESMLRPQLDRIDGPMLRSAGIETDGLWYEFSPLSELTETQKVDVAYKKAQTIKLYADMGMNIDALLEAAENGIIEDGTILPGFEAALEEYELDKPSGDDVETDPSALTQGAQLPEGGDPSAVAPGGKAPVSRAANDARFTDATPRTLYVRRDVVNVAEIQAWATKQGLGKLQPGLHVTIAYIDQPFDWMKVSGEWNQDKNGGMTITPGGVRIVEPLGDRTAVLLFTSSELSWRHESILRAAEYEDRYPSYQPHVSLTGDDVDLADVVPYRGQIVLGPEIFEEVRSGGE